MTQAGMAPRASGWSMLRHQETLLYIERGGGMFRRETSAVPNVSVLSALLIEYEIS